MLKRCRLSLFLSMFGLNLLTLARPVRRLNWFIQILLTRSVALPIPAAFKAGFIVNARLLITLMAMTRRAITSAKPIQLPRLARRQPLALLTRLMLAEPLAPALIRVQRRILLPVVAALFLSAPIPPRLPLTRLASISAKSFMHPMVLAHLPAPVHLASLTAKPTTTLLAPITTWGRPLPVRLVQALVRLLRLQPRNPRSRRIPVRQISYPSPSMAS